VATSVDDLCAVLAAGSTRPDNPDDPDDDVVTQLEHALQCAAQLALVAPDDLELQAAGLLHDIGHVLEPDDVVGHGGTARRFVEPLLGPRVGALVDLHVAAKRWLVTAEPSYHASLSEGSIRSLGIQGAELDPSERAAFESDPHHADAVRLRRAEEAAKVPGLAVAPLRHWRPVLDALA
jgi:predicted HD phosphohydrolase